MTTIKQRLVELAGRIQDYLPSRGKIALVASLLPGFLFPNYSLASDESVPTNIELKLKGSAGEAGDLMKTTVYAQRGGDELRVYNYAGSQGGVSVDKTSGGVRTTLSTGNLETQLTSFGSFGDAKGLGLEVTGSSKGVRITGNGELQEAKPKNNTRAGVGVDYRLIPSLEIGLGFDRLEGMNGRTEYSMVRLLAEPTQHNQTGASIQDSNSSNGKKRQQVDAFYARHSTGGFGTRTRVQGSWDPNDSEGQRTFTFNSLVATHNTTIGAGASPWINERRDGGMIEPFIVENPLRPEVVPLASRASGTSGLADVKYTWSKENGLETHSVWGEIGAKVQLNDLFSMTPTFVGDYSSSKDLETGHAGAHLILANSGAFGKGSIACIDSQILFPILDAEGKPELYVGVKAGFQF